MLSQISIGSRDSLDEILPILKHNSVAQHNQLKIEKRVKKYLDSLGLEYKTDPTEKQKQYYKSQNIVFSRHIGNQIITSLKQIEMVEEIANEFTPIQSVEFQGNDSWNDNEFKTLDEMEDTQLEKLKN